MEKDTKSESIEGRFKCFMGCRQKEVYFMLLYTVHYCLFLLFWTFSSDHEPFETLPVQSYRAFQRYLETDRATGGHWLQIRAWKREHKDSVGKKMIKRDSREATGKDFLFSHRKYWRHPLFLLMCTDEVNPLFLIVFKMISQRGVCRQRGKEIEKDS